MTDPIAVDVCRTPDGGKQANTVSVCLWCECKLKELLKDTNFKAGATGDDVKKLHEHLKRFGMTIELSDWKEKTSKFEDSADLSKGTWGAPTTRALRMFALHPQVGKETARIIKCDGKSLVADAVTKIQEWCRGKLSSPQKYWELPSLLVKDGDLDALGSNKDPEKQTVLHDFVAQIQRDLSKTGFGVHSDALCGLKKDGKATGIFKSVGKGQPDKELTDGPYLVGKFQRQATWLWRMKSDGTNLADAQATDPHFYSGRVDGQVDAGTAKALHAWVEADLHMVIKKFELKTLNWPPNSNTPIKNSDGGSARLRSDAYEAWLKAARQVEAHGGTLAGPYASSPRPYTAGLSGSSASRFSWHYSCLAIDIAQIASGDATVSENWPYGREKDKNQNGDDVFRIWCWATPQPPAPADPADDLKDPLKQYRNRNVRVKVARGSKIDKDPKQPSNTAPLYFATSDTNAAGNDVIDKTAREGWYVNISAILEGAGLKRIRRHKNWLTDPKAWEYWHYQYDSANAPPPGGSAKPTFGEFLQLYGVHEYLLRHVHWPLHEDIEHGAG